MRTATHSPVAEPAGAAGCALLIVRLARLTRHRLSEALAALDMRTHEFAVLQHLDVAGPLSQQELGSALRINPSNLVGLLDALEAGGSIVRPRDPSDRRRHLVELTAAGQRRLGRAKQAAEATEQDLLAPLSRAEREQFRGVLELLAGHACAAPDGGLPHQGEGRRC